jgi:hypothetical protein
MKKILIAVCLFSSLAFVACKGNPGTSSGDSTGTGAAGARVPGKTASDTTNHASTTGALSADTTKKADTLKK